LQKQDIQTSLAGQITCDTNNLTTSDCGSDACHMENYCNLDHTTREYHEIEETLIASGLGREKHNAFYCGTGWRQWFSLVHLIA